MITLVKTPSSQEFINYVREAYTRLKEKPLLNQPCSLLGERIDGEYKGHIISEAIELALKSGKYPALEINTFLVIHLDFLPRVSLEKSILKFILPQICYDPNLGRVDQHLLCWLTDIYKADSDVSALAITECLFKYHVYKNI